jgi:hypothetical protein
MARTRLSICRAKARYGSKSEAFAAAQKAPFALHPYRCDRGDHFHLTSRTKGKCIARPDLAKKPAPNPTIALCAKPE